MTESIVEMALLLHFHQANVQVCLELQHHSVVEDLAAATSPEKQHDGKALVAMSESAVAAGTAVWSPLVGHMDVPH